MKMLQNICEVLSIRFQTLRQHVCVNIDTGYSRRNDIFDILWIFVL